MIDEVDLIEVITLAPVAADDCCPECDCDPDCCPDGDCC